MISRSQNIAAVCDPSQMARKNNIIHCLKYHLASKLFFPTQNGITSEYSLVGSVSEM